MMHSSVKRRIDLWENKTAASEFDSFPTDFQANIPYISRIVYETRDAFGTEFMIYDILIKGDKLSWTYDNFHKLTQGDSLIEKETFFSTLSKFDIGNWINYSWMYSEKDEYQEFDLATEESICILDGQGWNMKITYDNKKTVCFNADNFYPDNFFEMERLIFEIINISENVNEIENVLEYNGFEI